MREIGQGVSEVLDDEPGSFHVVRYIRRKLACIPINRIDDLLPWAVAGSLRPVSEQGGRGHNHGPMRVNLKIEDLPHGDELRAIPAQPGDRAASRGIGYHAPI
jgi:hypothetical protein